jgi:hypothetical protein
MEPHAAVGPIEVDQADVGTTREAGIMRERRRHGHPLFGNWSDWRVVVIGPGRDVAIRERIPMPPEAGHADMHLAAAANRWHIPASRTVEDGAAARRERDLLVEREPVLQPHGAGRDRHRLTRAR